MFSVASAQAKDIASYAYLFDKPISGKAFIAGTYFFEFRDPRHAAEVSNKLSIAQYTGPLKIKLRPRMQ
jgi:hypothetical protein